RLVKNREVLLEKDISETDKFGRLLRYVYIEEKDQLILVNEELVRGGFAKASSYPPDIKFSEKFLEYEREARSSNRGLWGSCKSAS
ncbi:MAG: thermonuclease family protein, partial [Candidatus Daviesbacteria bacterium]|nr:thermonuclease family protein [Candidatus Daviesbacteria bacterium]